MTTDRTMPTVKRRPRTPGADKVRTYKCPDATYAGALAVAHARGMSLSSYIVEKLEELVAAESSRP
jgi:hypothetical protein